MNDIIMTTQSFKEAGGTEKYPDLDIGMIVDAEVMDVTLPAHPVSRNRLNALLAAQASKAECTHIFGITYEIGNSTYRSAYGTAYKPI